MIHNNLFYGLIIFFLIGATLSIVFNKKDRLSAFFILVISVAVFAVSIYSTGYMQEYYGKKNIGYLAFLFALIGFGAKAGIVPLHIWLPYAHPAAPSNVSPLIKESFKLEVHIEQIFERYIYAPVTDVILGRSRIIKLIQTGSIHAYLSYIYGTMVILMLYIILGGN